MNTGERLRKRFGLEDIENVRIGQALTSPTRIVFIVYDSFHPSWPITDYVLRQFPFPVAGYNGNDRDRPRMLPYIDIDEFSGVVDGKVIVVVDLADRRADEDAYSRSLESIVLPRKPVLQEDGFSIPDFRSNGVSSRNQSFLTQRRSDGRSGSELSSVSWNKRNDTLLLQYKSVPTYDSKVGVTTKNWSAGSTGSYKQPPHAKTAKSYKVQLKFDNVSEYIGKRSDYFSFTRGEQAQLISDLINTAPVRIHSNDKSFYFQGVWENGDEIGFSIHPFPGTQGTGEWSQKHVGEYPGIYVTKHILEVFERIEQDINAIVDRIDRKYQS